ncbi:MAG: hypothetical protein AB8B61_08865 [Cyclobacteriaceae bacterium]
MKIKLPTFTSIQLFFQKLHREAGHWFFIFLAIIGVVVVLLVNYIVSKRQLPAVMVKDIPAEVYRTEENYGKLADSLSAVANIPTSYIKALIALECSGRKTFSPRFESRVFTNLQKIRNGQLTNFGDITQYTIHDASDDALKNLASSWGPFQLMGYQCIELGVKVHDIRGSDALYWGIYWIKKRYGEYLRKRKFKDAFHIHNTGQPFPVFGNTFTHNPAYVNKGMLYVSCFELLR